MPEPDNLVTVEVEEVSTYSIKVPSRWLYARIAEKLKEAWIGKNKPLSDFPEDDDVSSAMEDVWCDIPGLVVGKSLTGVSSREIWLSADGERVKDFDVLNRVTDIISSGVRVQQDGAEPERVLVPLAPVNGPFTGRPARDIEVRSDRFFCIFAALPGEDSPYRLWVAADGLNEPVAMWAKSEEDFQSELDRAFLLSELDSGGRWFQPADLTFATAPELLCMIAEARGARCETLDDLRNPIPVVAG